MEELSKNTIAVLTYPLNKTGWTKEDLHNYNNYIRTFSPNKGKNMNVTSNITDTNGVEVVRHYYIDADGNEIEIPFDVAGEGETAQSETTIFVAEDAPDHPVTFH